MFVVLFWATNKLLILQQYGLETCKMGLIKCKEEEENGDKTFPR
jgi:hypothetical protein